MQLYFILFSAAAAATKAGSSNKGKQEVLL
jgi:hypothetical protein